MARDDLTLISYTVLILVGESGAGPHDLVRMMEDGRVYHAAAPSQYYAEPKRLERLGLLTSTKEPGRTRPRTVYRLTAAGREAVRAWLAEPTPVPRLTGEAHLRMSGADLGDEHDVRTSLLAMRPEIEELRASLAAGKERAASIPHRAKYLVLSHRLAEHVLDAYERWLAEVERELH